jgi:class 3 adenylate cyclase
MKTANLAIVFTDIKGFTARTSQQTYEENRRMLRVHDALLMPVFKAFGGRKIKTIGDAFLVVFESPTQAVLSGVAIQDRLWDYNRRVAEPEQIHVRVAINMGEVRLEAGDVFGEPVNIAARVEGLADAGEVLFTEAVYLSMNKAEVPAEERGAHALKGIPEMVKVYRVPCGAYRLGSQPAPQPATEPPPSGPPYGGLALARIADLPAPEPANLLAAGDFKEVSAEIALGAAKRARGLWLRFASLPRKIQAVVGIAILLVAVGAIILTAWGSSPVEAALSRGDLKRAEAELKKLKPGRDRAFLEGRLDEERKDFAAAARHYEDAARLDHRRAYKRLLQMTESEQCWSRANAAYSLARLKRKTALPALQALQQASFADEGSSNVLRELFGCNSHRAAADAIKSLESPDKD